MWNDHHEKPNYEEGGSVNVRQVGDSDVHMLTPFTVPWSNQYSRPVSQVYKAYDGPGTDNNGEFTIVAEVMGDGDVDAYHGRRDDAYSLPATKSRVVLSTSSDSGLSQKAFLRHIQSFQNGKIIKAVIDDNETRVDKKDKESDTKLLYSNNGRIFMACFVRLLLFAHNILAVWRVTDAYNEDKYWLLVIANFFLLIEGMVVIIKNAGMEYSWWCPCFLIYLASTIPAIWLLQLNQYDRFVNPGKWTTTTPYQTTPTTSLSVQNMTTPFPANVTANFPTDLLPVTTANETSRSLVSTTSTNGMSSGQTTEINTTITTTPVPDEPVLGSLDNDVWVIIIEESLVYLLVFSRWLLPRGTVSRDFLADLLLEFLAIASDIMELLAVFDQNEVRGHLKLTYAILAVWSASFIQFIPVLMQRKRFRKVRNPNVEWITRYFGDKFVEIVVTCMSIFLQDLPFLVVRLYIIIQVKLITYSLIFFLLKNIVTLMLLFYRLTILCYRLPHCKGKPA